MAAQKKKKWYKIIAPKNFRNTEIGEIPTVDAETLVGRNARVNAVTVMNDPRKQHLRLTFRINEVKADQAHTELLGYEIVQAQIKRMSRKGSEKIDDSFVAEAKGGVKVRLKPVLTTRGRANNSVKTAIRKSIQTQVSEDLKKKNFEDFMMDVVSNKTQRALKDSLKKLYPIGGCEFRKIRIVQQK